MTEPLQQIVAALELARSAIEPLTGAQIRLHRIPADTADKIDAALALARSMKQGDGWQPIETAPKGDNERVLLFCPRAECMAVGW